MRFGILFPWFPSCFTCGSVENWAKVLLEKVENLSEMLFLYYFNVFLCCCFFLKTCENKGPVMRKGLLRTWPFAFFVAGFDVEKLENSSYSSYISKNLFDFKKLMVCLSCWKSVSVLLLHIMISLRNLQRRRQCTTKTVHQSTTRVMSRL